MADLEARDRIAAINEDAAAFYRAQLCAPPNAGPRSYLTARGFARLLEDTEWTVGYAPGSWTALRDHLACSGYSDELMLEAGLTSISRRGNCIDRFRDRITFGIRRSDHALVGFTARAAPANAVKSPKYLNTPRTAAYDKSAVLFGVGEAKTRRAGVSTVITEGPLDAIAVSLLGESRWVPLALCGTSLTSEHARSISTLTTHLQVLALDDDGPGHGALEHAVAVLTSVRGEPQFAALGRSQDPADVFAERGSGALQAALESCVPASDRVIGQILERWDDGDDNILRHILCLREAARTLVDMRVPCLARHAARLAENLNLGSSVVTSELANAASPARFGGSPAASARAPMIRALLR